MRGFKVLACLVIAYANVAASYNPYSYNARFLPQTMSADAYSSMGDIDWAKRGYRNRYNWYTPNYYAYASMADADWGWKKRSMDDSIDNPIPEALYPDEKRGAVQKSYKYKQPYMRARPSLDAAYSDSIANLIPKWVGKRVNHPLVGKRDGLVHPMVGKRALVHPMAGKRYDHPMAGKRVDHPMVGKRTPIFYQPYQAYARYGGLVSKPQTRNNLGERQYSYASMADMDWGWKKRSQWPALLENEDYEIVPDDEMIDNLELEKKNLASLAAHNMFPEKRLLKAPKARPLILGKRDSDDLEILENDGNFNEEKRNLASIARSSRSGISSLIRNGGLRQKQT